MLTDDFIRYAEGIRRYSPRTIAIYSSAIEDFLSYISIYSNDSPDSITHNEGGQNEHILSSRERDEALAAALSPAMLRNYEVHLMEERGLDARTVNLHMSVLSSLCKYLLGRGILKSNPAKAVYRPKCAKRLPFFYKKEMMEEYFNKTRPYADMETFEELIASCPILKEEGKKKSSIWKNTYLLYERRLNRLIINILYETGIRRSELIGMNVSFLDISRRTIRIKGKGDKMREIPVTPSLCKEISLYLKVADSLEGRERTGDEPLLITSSGRRLYPVYVDRAVKSELGQIEGISGRKSPHTLRHTLATELLDDGAGLYSIKELLGHSSLAATQIYTHNSVEKIKTVYSIAHPRAKRGGNTGD